jgi:chromosome partitioning protein
MKLAVANIKGGVAKTTSSIYVAEAIVHRGGSAIVYDADPQSSASLWADAARDNGEELGFEVRPANLSTLSPFGAGARAPKHGRSWTLLRRASCCRLPSRRLISY